MNAAYHSTVTLSAALAGVECWNESKGTPYTLPAGARLLVEHAYDARHTVCMHVSATDQAVPLPGSDGRAYRFIVLNTDLNRLAGTKLPEATDDLVGAIMAIEDGSATEAQEDLVYTDPICLRLQGRHSSRYRPQT